MNVVLTKTAMNEFTDFNCKRAVKNKIPNDVNLSNVKL